MLTIATFISTILSALLLTSEIVILEQLGTALLVVVGLIILKSSDKESEHMSEIDTAADERV